VLVVTCLNQDPNLVVSNHQQSMVRQGSQSPHLQHLLTCDIHSYHIPHQAVKNISNPRACVTTLKCIISGMISMLQDTVSRSRSNDCPAEAQLFPRSADQPISTGLEPMQSHAYSQLVLPVLQRHLIHTTVSPLAILESSGVLSEG